MPKTLISNSAAVKKTNDSCTVSKWSVVNSGYYNDSVLSSFVDCANKKRASLINRCYCVRFLCVDRALHTFIKFSLENFPSDVIQVVVLGAGFDSSFWRVCGEYSTVPIHYVEVDFPDVCRRKCSLAVSSGHIKNEKIIHDSQNLFMLKYSPSDTADFTSVGCDMTNDSLFQSTLSDILRQDAPTIVIAEVVLVYMKMEDRLRVLQSVMNKKVANKLQVFLTYEQLARPEVDAFTHTMLASFRQQQSPLLSFFTSPDSVSMFWGGHFGLENDYTVFKSCASIFYALKSEDRMRYCNLEPIFDEFEPFHLKCAIYFLAMACFGIHAKAFIKNLSMHFPEDMLIGNAQSKSLVDMYKYLMTTPLRCYGFGMSYVTIDHLAKCVVVGGFGYQNDRGIIHSRTRSVMLFDPYIGEVCPVELNGTDRTFFDRLYCTVTTLRSTFTEVSLFVFGGRQSPSCSVLSYGKLTLKKGSDGSYSATLDSVAQLQSGIDQKSQAEMPTPHPRFRHVACLISINGKSFVFIHGGRFVGSFEQTAFDDAWLYAPDESIWYRCSFSGDNPSDRHSHAADLYESSMLLMGGLSREEVPLADLWLIRVNSRNEKANTYILSSEKIETIPALEPRYGHSASICRNNLLVIVGGVCPLAPAFSSPEIVVVNMDTRSVSLFSAAPNLLPSCPFMFVNHRSVIVSGDKGENLVVVGGGANCFSFGTHFNSNALCIPVKALLCQ